MEVMDITPVEMRMLSLIRQGLSSSELARLNHCSPNAVRLRIFKLFKKFGCSNRAELVAYGYETGIFNSVTKQPQQ